MDDEATLVELLRLERLSCGLSPPSPQKRLSLPCVADGADFRLETGVTGVTTRPDLQKGGGSGPL